MTTKENIKRFRDKGINAKRGFGEVHKNINCRALGINPYDFCFSIETPFGIIVLKSHPLFSYEGAEKDES